MGDHNLPRILQLLERAREKAKSGEFHEAIKEYEAGIRVLNKITNAPDMARFSGKIEDLRYFNTSENAHQLTYSFSLLLD
jgi:hypothetical protein